MTSLNTYLRSERRDPAGGLNGVVTKIENTAVLVTVKTVAILLWKLSEMHLSSWIPNRDLTSSILDMPSNQEAKSFSPLT